MLSIRQARIVPFAFVILGGLCCAHGHAQAALLMEEPYGFFGTLNPTGHNAIYLERVCAETPVKLRRCQPGELGVVIARYQGIDGYDWVAIPLIPYLYSVENAAEAPSHVDRETAMRLRGRYHLILQHPEILGPDNLSALTAQTAPLENSTRTGALSDRSLSVGPSAGTQVSGATPDASAVTLTGGGANPSLRGTGAANE